MAASVPIVPSLSPSLVTSPSGSGITAAAAMTYAPDDVTTNMQSRTSAAPFLIADIGGTNCRLNLLTITPDGVETELGSQVYASKQFSHLCVVIKKFLHQYVTSTDQWPVAACLAVAGPVRGNKVQLTNLKWLLDGDEMARELKIGRVTIINDFVGIGYGLLALESKDVVVLNGGTHIPDGPKACIGAGTGLGQAYLTCARTPDSSYEVWPSEGGHCDFAPRDDKEFGLLTWMKSYERVPRISVERVVSGPGLPLIYRYLAGIYPDEVSSDVEARLRTEDAGMVIATCARERSDRLCRLAMQMFIGAFGAEAGNLALKTLPTGGLYIAGGVAPKNLWALQENHQFVNNCVDKGRMKEFLESMPIYVVMHPQPGLLGAKVICKRSLRHMGFDLKGRHENFDLRPVVPVTSPISSSSSSSSSGAVTPSLSPNTSSSSSSALYNSS